jgi:hypothetical protein
MKLILVIVGFIMIILLHSELVVTIFVQNLKFRNKTIKSAFKYDSNSTNFMSDNLHIVIIGLIVGQSLYLGS